MHLRKVRFAVLGYVAVTNVYGYVLTVTSMPVRNMITGFTTITTIAIYDEDGIRIDIDGKVAGTSWEVLPFSAYVWNDQDLADAINAFKEYR